MSEIQSTGGDQTWEKIPEVQSTGGDEIWTTIPSTDAYFVFTQGVASDTWNITHNLGKNPSVTVVDSAGNEMQGQTIYINDNQLQLCFSAPFSGKAYLN